MSLPLYTYAQITKVGSSIQVDGAKETLPIDSTVVAYFKSWFDKVYTIQDPVSGDYYCVTQTNLGTWIKNNPDFFVDKLGDKVTIKKGEIAVSLAETETHHESNVINPASDVKAIDPEDVLRHLNQLLDHSDTEADVMQVNKYIALVRADETILKKMTQEDIYLLDEMKEKIISTKVFNEIEGLKADIINLSPNLTVKR